MSNPISAAQLASHVDGAGPDLALLHGGPGLSDYMEQLSDETSGWRTIRYQQRGLAPSTTSGPFTVAQHLDDLVSVLDAAGAERCVVLGHSWGTHLALQAALGHPDRVRALVLVDPFGVAGDGGAAALSQEQIGRLAPAAQAQLLAVAQRLATPDASENDAAELLALQWPGYFADPPNAPPLPAGLRLSVGVNVETMGSVFEELAAGFAERLGSLTLPVEIVLGEKSPIPLSVGYETTDRIPGAAVTVVAGAGHLPWYERPGAVQAALDRVTARLS